MLRLHFVFALILSVVAESGSAAWATTCSSTGGAGGDLKGHYYSGQDSTTNVYGGIEGSITNRSVTPNNATFGIDWLGAVMGKYCVNEQLAGLCSIQAGYGSGDVGGYIDTYPIQVYYMEVEDVNDYTVNWVGYTPTPVFYVSVFFTGEVNAQNGDGLWDAYVTPSGGSPMLVGQGWFKDPSYYNANEAAESEIDYQYSGTCEVMPDYQYYGTNASGTYTSGNSLELSPDGASWSPWSSYGSGSAGTVVNSPYQFTAVSGEDAFRANGG